MADVPADRPTRDVKNHLLFEIATEVAHRGKKARRLRSSCASYACWGTNRSTWLQWVVSTPSSSPRRQ